jgi:hypothetical protein
MSDYSDLHTGIPVAANAGWARKAHRAKRRNMSFALYILGFIVLVVGLAVGAHLMHIPLQWIGVGVLVMIGLGIVTGATATRQRDSSN